MSYHLKRPTHLAAGLRAVARDQLQQAADDLGGDDLHEGVHQARKRGKKVRALLRLARDPLGRAYGELNTAVRDIARRLSDLRDASALLESLDALERCYADQMAAATFQAARRALEERRQAIAADHDLDRLAREAAVELRALAADTGRWPLADSLDFDHLEPGLRRTYARGRDALEAARDGDADAVHEWRKRCKYLRHQLRLLRDCWEAPMGALIDEIDRLGTHLGDHHDLAVLRATLDQLDPDGLDDERTLQTLHALIDARSAELLAAALPLGERIWCEKPKAFTRRIAAWWAAWAATPEHPVALATTD